MKLLILFSQPWGVGGAETHTEALIQGLAGHEVHLVVNKGGKEERLRALCAKFPNLRLLRIQMRGANIFGWIASVKKLRAFVRREGIEGIFAQQRTAGIWAYWIAKETKATYTVTMHDPWHRALFKTIYKEMFPWIFTVSRNLSNALKRDFKFADAQIHELDNGIDFAAFQTQDKAVCREKLNLGTGGKMLLHVSRLSRIKGAVALKLIESMPDLLRREPELELVIIGEGPLREELEQKVLASNLQHGAHIKIHDFVDNIADWYCAADALVGEGRVAVEAQSCLRPVVAIRNAEAFMGVITPINIAYACDVNFDGNDFVVSAEKLAEEVQKAFRATEEDCGKIASYIRRRLSIEAMTARYLDAVRIMCEKKGCEK